MTCASARRHAGCDFCEIAAGAGDAQVVYEDANVIAFYPLRPAGLGHTLVIPRSHVRFLWEIERDTAEHLISAVVNVSQALHHVFSPDGLNLINSSGEAATQTVFHLHMHLVPRWNGDHMGEIWPPAAHWSEAIEPQTAAALRAFFATRG